ncbi:hypothetical protein POM88_052766 [Heracleum sosnowskyi]|uniref:F-box domain-containing protein n=1 Tax=Heracleum sosnowskyi TaxID=360622 RepID=A0AAD8GQY0_9APIA|nr:hypothetical protein POM88_052766 [Heracleum sosnowskyi]
MMKGTNSITDLHEHIILEILFFLPAKSIIRCSCVCKDWAKLIHQPYFPHEYLSRGKAPLQLVLGRDNSVVLAQFDEDLYTASAPSDFSVPESSIFDLNIGLLPIALHSPVYTCAVRSWILALYLHPCIAYYPDRQYYKSCLYYCMYNPITGQHIVVEHTKRVGLKWRNSALIFVEKTNQLKLLEFHCNEQGRAEAYIRTIVTGTWRSIVEVRSTNAWRRIVGVPHQDFRRGLPVLLNGRYHWLDCNTENSKMVINSLDAREEIFRVIQTPMFVRNYESKRLGLLDGRLCLAMIDWESEVWMMNKYGIQDSWTKTFAISMAMEPLTWLKNGELLMLGHYMYRRSETVCSAMICYNPRSETRRYVHSHTPETMLTRVFFN